MGTSYKVILYGQEIQTSRQEVNDIFENVNQEMSTYLSTSSISQINNIDKDMMDEQLSDDYDKDVRNIDKNAADGK